MVNDIIFSVKFHKRPTPLTGGIGIFIALLVSGKLYIDLNDLTGYLPDFTFHLMLISIPLLGLFLIDDISLSMLLWVTCVGLM